MNKAKKLLIYMLLILLAATHSFALASDTSASEALYEFPWGPHTLGIRSVVTNPEHLVGNPTPDTTEYLMVRLKCISGAVQIIEIVEHNVGFSLSDESGETYESAAYFPYAISYNESNKVFTTAMEQPCFDIFFILPKGTPTESLTLHVKRPDMDDPSVIPFSDPLVQARVQSEG